MRRSPDSIVIPLEQGLRLVHIANHAGTVDQFYCHSIRTRIKTPSIRPNGGYHHNSIVIPLEQGLRRFRITHKEWGGNNSIVIPLEQGLRPCDQPGRAGNCLSQIGR